MDTRYDNWREFRELWESSDPQTRLNYLIRRRELHEYVRDADYLKLLMHWNKDTIEKSSKARIKIFLYSATAIILSFFISISDDKLFIAILTALLAFFVIIIFRISLSEAIIDLKNYNVSFRNQLHLKKGEPLDIDSLLYIMGNKYLLEEKMEKDEDQEYENCLLYFQKLHIEILKNSQVNKEPDVFP